VAYARGLSALRGAEPIILRPSHHFTLLRVVRRLQVAFGGLGTETCKKLDTCSFEDAFNLALGIGIQNFPEGLAVSMPLRRSGESRSLHKLVFLSANAYACGSELRQARSGHGRLNVHIATARVRSLSYPRARLHAMLDWLYFAGVGLFTSFFFGQLSGMVEPVAGVIGSSAVQVRRAMLHCAALSHSNAERWLLQRQTMEPVLPYAMAFAAGAMVFVVVDDLIPEAQVHGNGRAASLGCMVGFIVMMSLDVALG
jgi:hypothetical protein